MNLQVNSGGGARHLIKASGGLLWRTTPRGEELAVIHRARYGDWTLPKGKLQAGEDWAEAALREVKEETGCDAELESFAGTVSYRVDGVPKLVLFWNMTPLGDCEFKPSEEVREIVWLRPREAIDRLDYPGERALVMSRHPEFASRSTWWSRLWRGRISPSRTRLARALSTYRVELQDRTERAKLKRIKHRSWSKAAQGTLTKAEAALDEGNIELGWSLLNAAKRIEFPGLFELDQEAFRARALGIVREAEAKLRSWRKEVVEELLLENGELKPKVGPEEVSFASFILHEHFDNDYHKRRMARRQLIILGSVLTLALLAFLSYMQWFAPFHGFVMMMDDPRFIIAVALFGVMGAAFSGTSSIAQDAVSARIPEQLMESWISLARVAVGAVAAVVIYYFLLSGLLQIAESLSAGLVLAASFAAGFSERLVLRAVGAVSP